MRFCALVAFVLSISGPAVVYAGPGPSAAQDRDPAQLAREAASAQTRGDYQSAASLYQQLLQAGQDSPELHSNLGVMLYLTGNDRGAIEQFHIALARKPELLASNLFSGLSLVRLGRPRDALAFLKKAEEEQPNALAPLLAIGRANVAVKDIQSAREAYRRATELNPNSAEAWYGRGITSRELADQMLNQASHGGQRADLAKGSPQAGAARKDLDEAETSMSRAIALDPNGIHTHLILGEAFRVSGEAEKSIGEYQAAIKGKPNSVAAYLGLANTYWKFDRYDEAMTALKKVLSLSPADPEANGIMAYLLVSENKLKQAEPLAQRALAGRPDLLFVHAALAKIYLAQGELSKALPELEAAAPGDEDGSYHYLLFQTLRKLGRAQEAAAALQVSQQESKRVRQSQTHLRP
jgi:tetratricopeptide (TPR) repeat protein